MGVNNLNGLDPHQRAFIKLVNANCHRRRSFEVFRDFCELSALSFSNAIDLQQREAREARYLDIVKGYTRDEVNRFPAMLAELVGSLTDNFHDALGEIFMALDLASHWHGQFFTPYTIASMMARMTLTGVDERIESNGFFTVCEPAAGAGAMLIAVAEAVAQAGHNPQQTMHATAVDVDATAAHMTYVQLSLLHIPAIVVHGNSLSLQEWSHWVTPAHVLGLWDMRLRRSRHNATAACQAAVTVDAATPVAPESDAVVAVRDAVLEIRAPLSEQLGLFI